MQLAKLLFMGEVLGAGGPGLTILSTIPAAPSSAMMKPSAVPYTSLPSTGVSPSACPVSPDALQKAAAIFQLNPQDVLFTRLETIYNMLQAMEVSAFCAARPPGSYCFKSSVTRLLAEQIAAQPEGSPMPSFPLNPLQWGGFGPYYQQCAEVSVVQCPSNLIQRCRPNNICQDMATMTPTGATPTPTVPIAAVEAGYDSDEEKQILQAMPPTQPPPTGGQAMCRFWPDAAFAVLGQNTGPTRTIVVVRSTQPGAVAVSQQPVSTIRLATITLSQSLQLECTVATLSAVPALATDGADLATAPLMLATDTTVQTVALPTPTELCWNANLPLYVMPTPCPGGPYPPGIIKKMTVSCPVSSLPTSITTPIEGTQTSLAELTSAFATTSEMMSASSYPAGAGGIAPPAVETSTQNSSQIATSTQSIPPGPLPSLTSFCPPPQTVTITGSMMSSSLASLSSASAVETSTAIPGVSTLTTEGGAFEPEVTTVI